MNGPSGSGVAGFFCASVPDRWTLLAGAFSSAVASPVAAARCDFDASASEATTSFVEAVLVGAGAAAGCAAEVTAAAPVVVRAGAALCAALGDTFVSVAAGGTTECAVLFALGAASSVVGVSAVTVLLLAGAAAALRAGAGCTVEVEAGGRDIVC